MSPKAVRKVQNANGAAKVLPAKPLTDLEIAHATRMRPVTEIAEKLGLSPEHLHYYGQWKAKVDLAALKAPQTLENPSMVTAKPVPSHKTTVAPPVAMTPTNIIKSPIGMTAPKQAPVSPPTPTIAGATSNNPLSGAPTAAGAPGKNEGGIGTGGAGQGGTGTGQGDVGAGTGEGPAGGVPAIATRLPAGAGRAMGNIAPYRKDLLLRLAQNWHPKRTYENLIVLVVLDHDGHLVSSEIFQSSGNKKGDKEALEAVQATEYAPLPDWFKGETLTFKIELSKVEALQQ